MKGLLFILLLLPLFSLAQQSDSQLAYTYYENKEYDKAAECFFKLYERTRSSSYLDYHIICLINGKQYDKAEETLKKFLKTDDNNKDFLINLGYIYEQQGKPKKTEEYYERAIKKLIPHTNDIQNLANKFRNIREYGWATKTYLKGRELINQPNAFINELGDNYMMERDYENMFALFVQSLKMNPASISTITSKLSFARSSDVDRSVDAVIEEYLKNIFSDPKYSPAFDELAVWYALQKNDYRKAFDHAVKLNAKSENKINIYIDIAREASNSKNYAIAKEAYNKVLLLGKEDNNFYNTAQKEMLTCKYAECELQQSDAVTYKLLASESEEYMKENGYINSNTDILLMLADIYAYRLNVPDSANQLLVKGENIPRLDSRTLNILKSKRADLLAYTGNPWEATILYTQIEKANPNNDTGYEAKLKKAWLAYYQGDIIWAKAQFDVLKGATSKLISNDAIKMSHFINSNYEEESSTLEQLAQTEYRIYRKQYAEALPTLDSLIDNSTPGIADYASLEKAQLLMAEFKNQEAVIILKNLKENSGQVYIKAEAIYELAGLKAGTSEQQEALELYKLLVSEYSGSVYSVEAGRKYRELTTIPK